MFYEVNREGDQRVLILPKHEIYIAFVHKKGQYHKSNYFINLSKIVEEQMLKVPDETS